MAFKFALIAALSIAQAFAFPPVGKFPWKKPCNPISELAQDIPLEFEETMQEIDDVREIVSMTAAEAYIKGNDPEVIIACFKQQKELYMKVGQKISGMVKEASDKMKEELGENYEKFGNRAAEPMKTIGMTMKTLPEKMWIYMKEKEFSKAFEVMRESRKVVEQNSRVLAQIIREMAQEYPESAKKAEEMAREIREESRKGCKQIGEAFRKCVQEGGPKQPIEGDSKIDAEVEENPEQ